MGCSLISSSPLCSGKVSCLGLRIGRHLSSFPVKISTRREAQDSLQAGLYSTQFWAVSTPLLLSWAEGGKGPPKAEAADGETSTLPLGCLHTSPQAADLAAFGEEHPPHHRKQQEGQKTTVLLCLTPSVAMETIRAETGGDQHT